MATPQDTSSEDNASVASGPLTAVQRALGASEILNIVLEHVERERQLVVGQVATRWGYNASRIYWRDPPPGAYRNQAPRVVADYAPAVRTLYAPRRPADLAGWAAFPGVRLLHLPFGYARRAEALRAVLARCGARLRSVVFAATHGNAFGGPDGPHVRLRFVSFAHVDERVFGFYQDDAPESEEAGVVWDDASNSWQGLPPGQAWPQAHADWEASDEEDDEEDDPDVNPEPGIIRKQLRRYNDLHVDVLPQLATRSGLENLDIQAPIVRADCLHRALDYAPTLAAWLAEQPPESLWTRPLVPRPRLPLFASLQRFSARLFIPVARDVLPRALAAAPLKELTLVLLGPGDVGSVHRALADTFAATLRALSVEVLHAYVPFRAVQPLHALRQLRALAVTSLSAEITTLPPTQLHEMQVPGPAELADGILTGQQNAAALVDAAVAEANEHMAEIVGFFDDAGNAVAAAALTGSAPVPLGVADVGVRDADWERFVAALPELRHLTLRVASRLSYAALRLVGRACRRLRSLDVHAPLHLWEPPADLDAEVAPEPEQPPRKRQRLSRAPARVGRPDEAAAPPAQPVLFPHLRHLRTVGIVHPTELAAPPLEPASAINNQAHSIQRQEEEDAARPDGHTFHTWRAERFIERLRRGAPRLVRVLFRGQGEDAFYEFENDVEEMFRERVMDDEFAGCIHGGDDDEEPNIW